MQSRLLAQRRFILVTDAKRGRNSSGIQQVHDSNPLLRKVLLAVADRFPRLKKGALIDIQGTLLAPDGTAFPHAAEAVRALAAAGVDVRYVTNIDSVGVAEIVRRLRAAGIQAEDSQVFSPVSALKQFLGRQGNPRVHLLVPPQIEHEFADYRNGERSDYVVVGDCREGFTYDRLTLALRRLMEGASLVALQKGRYYLAEDGQPAPDTGAFVAALEYASGKQAYVLGKPSTELLRIAIEDMGCDPYETLVVGDDVASDIAGAYGVGARSVLVRTGKFSLDALERSERKPDVLLDSIADLPGALGEVFG